jgi:hypothetical protein
MPFTRQPDRPQMTPWHMHFARWITEATNTHSENVILIPFPQQQWLCKHASVLCYTYVASLVWLSFLGHNSWQEELIFLFSQASSSSLPLTQYGIKLTNVLHLVLMLRMHGDVPPIPHIPSRHAQRQLHLFCWV